MKLDSVIFHTTRLADLRQFYEGELGLKPGTFLRDGIELPDCSETYVNYHLDGTLLCFEFEEGRTDLGAVVLKVSDAKFETFRARFAPGATKPFFKVKDPEGRSLIVERG